jgi:hypothetical protein
MLCVVTLSVVASFKHNDYIIGRFSLFPINACYQYAACLLWRESLSFIKLNVVILSVLSYFNLGDYKASGFTVFPSNSDYQYTVCLLC